MAAACTLPNGYYRRAKMVDLLLKTSRKDTWEVSAGAAEKIWLPSPPDRKTLLISFSQESEKPRMETLPNLAK